MAKTTKRKKKQRIVKTVIFLLLTCTILSLNAQFIDTIKVCLHTPPKPLIKLNNKGSFVANRPASVLGIVFGLAFNKKLKLGLGYNQVNSLIHKQYVFNDFIGNTVDTFTTTLKLMYISTYFEYIYYYSKHFEISIPLQFGIGYARYDFKAGTKTYYIDNQLGFIYEAYTEAVYKPIKYFGLGAGFGYRLTLFSDWAVIKQFTSPIYSISLKIYPTQIINAFKKKS